MMTYHILNGDALASQFSAAKLAGELIVVREGLMAGDLSGETLSSFWRTRAKYMEVPYPQYYGQVVAEFEKIMSAPEHSVFNLWFGYDLFCQVNLWFVLSVLCDLPIEKEVFMVYPTFLPQAALWEEFGEANA